MLKDISYSPSCKHARPRAQIPGTTLEQLITVGTPSRDRHSDQNARSIPGPAREHLIVREQDAGRHAPAERSGRRRLSAYPLPGRRPARSSPP
jgi:hypothetical protein